MNNYKVQWYRHYEGFLHWRHLLCMDYWEGYDIAEDESGDAYVSRLVELADVDSHHPEVSVLVNPDAKVEDVRRLLKKIADRLPDDLSTPPIDME